jgi:hypothetical protein
MLNSATFGNTSVSIEVDEFNNIHFWVDGAYSVKEKNPHRVAITRWLVKEWKQIKGNYKYLFCSAYDDDYLFYDRVNSYKRLGFISLKNNAFIYLNFSSKEEQDKIINELLTHYHYPEEFSPLTEIEEEGFFYLWVERTIPELGFYEPVPLPIKEKVHLRRRRRS